MTNSTNAGGVFRSLNSFNFRIWTAGGVVSNVGTWMQRIAQDWLVLTQLTHHNATAVGIVTALQFAPQLLLLPLTGFAADHLNQRKLLLATQAAMGVLALGLGMLTVAGVVRLWHVYAFAFVSGCAAAFDAPVRQTFVSELVGEADLSNAVAVNSTSFNAARLVGPAIAGILIALTGCGWMFLINAASFAAVLASLLALRVQDLHYGHRALRSRGSLAEGFGYVHNRPDLYVILIMLFFVGTFGFNFPIYISTMSVSVFHLSASQFGLLTSVMAIGSLAGAYLAANRARPRMSHLLGAVTVFGVGFALAAVAPDYWLFGATLIVIGAASVLFTTSTSSLMQLSSDPVMRGRVMAIRIAVAAGGAPVGAPIVGWVADRFGPRWAMVIAAVSGLAAAAAALHYLFNNRNLRIVWSNWRIRIEMDDDGPASNFGVSSNVHGASVRDLNAKN